jgi:hypothetical protein
VLPLSDCAALKQNCQSLLVLGHESWLPSTTTPLIEEIRERVFIFTSMLRELDHDSLIFFHADGIRRYVWNSMRILSAERRNFEWKVTRE